MSKLSFIVLIFCIFIFSCATAGKMNQIKTGMTRTQVIEVLVEGRFCIDRAHRSHPEQNIEIMQVIAATFRLGYMRDVAMA